MREGGRREEEVRRDGIREEREGEREREGQGMDEGRQEREREGMGEKRLLLEGHIVNK